MTISIAIGSSTTTSLDVIQSVGPALLALGGVWLGSRFARGREDRSWRRTQIVKASSSYLAASVAVEQWAASEQFAERLGANQYPTDYKRDLESLGSATEVLRISTADGIVVASERATAILSEYVEESARHQANKPRGSATEANRYQRDVEDWKSREELVEKARENWLAARHQFVIAVRAELEGLG
jgi:hypothetical protein